MSQDNGPQTTLREELETQLSAAESAQQDQQAQVTPPPATQSADGEGDAQAAAQRARDEQGRFAKADQAAAQKAQAQSPAQSAQAPAASQALPRPTTWKKEYLPIWDKLATGQPLTPEEARKLAEYSNQRENEYKTGVSTYKSEAVAAREVQEAIAPFMPKLQQYGIAPAQWIRSMGEANAVLEGGTPQQKLGLIAELCQRYNVPIQAIVQPQHPGQANPALAMQNALAQEIQSLRQQLGQVTTWQSTQEASAMQSEVQRFMADTERHPHVEAVRDTMAQLLERGVAQDLQTAYDKACWMVDEVREAIISDRARALAQPQVVAKAKAAAVSPRSATPSGQVTTQAAKDRRSLLAGAFDEVEGGRV